MYVTFINLPNYRIKILLKSFLSKENTLSGSKYKVLSKISILILSYQKYNTLFYQIIC